MAKKLAILITIGFFVFCVATVAYYYFFAAFPTLEVETQNNYPNLTSLELVNSNGLIQVEGEERDDTAVDRTLVVVPRLAWFGVSLAAKAQEIIAVTEGRLSLREIAPHDWMGHGRIELQLRVPRAMAVEARSGNANITLQMLDGPVSIAQSGNSTILLEQLTGPINASANAGMIRAVLGESTAPAQLAMRDGQILLTLTDPHPPAVQITASEGKVILYVHPDLNAFLTYSTKGVVLNQLTEEKPSPKPSDGKPVALKLGAGGAAISIQAGNADFTIQPLNNK